MADSKTLAEKRREEMNDPKSNLRNQVSQDDVVDFQLLSNTPAQVIEAMTGISRQDLEQRAKELNTTLKGSLAGDFRPQ